MKFAVTQAHIINIQPKRTKYFIFFAKYIAFTFKLCHYLIKFSSFSLLILGRADIGGGHVKGLNPYKKEN